MKEAKVEIILARAREKFPQAGPRIISDNGPQFIACDFKEFIRVCGMTHVRTSPFSPPSNAACESFIKTLKYEEVYRTESRDLADTRASIGTFLEKVYNQKPQHRRSATCPRQSSDAVCWFKPKGRPLRDSLPYEFFEA